MIVGGGTYTGALPITATQIADGAGYMLLIVVRGVLRLAVPRAATGRPRNASGSTSSACFFLAAALFWSLFEQAGSTLNLFADRDTRTTVFGWSYPSSWFQSMNSMFVWALRAGVRVAVAVARPRRQEPSTPDQVLARV